MYVLYYLHQNYDDVDFELISSSFDFDKLVEEKKSLLERSDLDEQKRCRYNELQSEYYKSCQRKVKYFIEENRDALKEYVPYTSLKSRKDFCDSYGEYYHPNTIERMKNEILKNLSENYWSKILNKEDIDKIFDLSKLKTQIPERENFKEEMPKLDKIYIKDFLYIDSLEFID
jgi:hypothetical protein